MISPSLDFVNTVLISTPCTNKRNIETKLVGENSISKTRDQDNESIKQSIQNLLLVLIELKKERMSKHVIVLKANYNLIGWFKALFFEYLFYFQLTNNVYAKLYLKC